MPAAPAQAVAAPNAAPPTANEPRTWTITTDTGFSISGHLPTWADDDPSQNQLPVDRLGIALSDINHHHDVCGEILALPLRTPEDHGRHDQAVPVLCGSIDCNPYAAEPELRVPVFNFHLVDDYRIEALGPDGITELAAIFRAHANALDQRVRPALIEARNAWARHRAN